MQECTCGSSWKEYDFHTMNTENNMSRMKFKVAGLASQFEVYYYTGDDGYPTSKVFSPVYVETEDGRSFILPQGKKVTDEDGFQGYGYRYENQAQLAAVQAAGDFDPAQWVEVKEEDFESYEERFAPGGSEWQREQEER